VIAALARRVDDAIEVAKVTGTSVPRAQRHGHDRQVRSDSGELGEALKGGEVSLEQATEIARAEAARLHRAARKVTEEKGEIEPFEAYLADAYAALMSGSSRGRAGAPSWSCS
jgi:hypothetical protein